MRPFIVKIVSVGRGRGKTRLLTHIVTSLSKRGLCVGVVKHCSESIQLPDRDAENALRAGAMSVVVSSRGLGVLYLRDWVDSLAASIAFLTQPIILVEGFKDSPFGDLVIQVAQRGDEILPRISAVVSDSCDWVEGARCIEWSSIDKLVDEIEKSAHSHILSQLPGQNCGLCGYDTCAEAARAVLRGEGIVCPRMMDVVVEVDGRSVWMNPFVKKMLTRLIDAFLDTLHGVPRERRRIEISIRLSP